MRGEPEPQGGSCAGSARSSRKQRTENPLSMGGAGIPTLHSCSVSGLMRAPGEEEPKCPRMGGAKATRDPTVPEVTSRENNSIFIPGSGCCFLSRGLALLAATGSCSRESPGWGGCRDKDPTSRSSHLLPSCCKSPSGSSGAGLGGN